MTKITQLHTNNTEVSERILIHDFEKQLRLDQIKQRWIFAGIITSCIIGAALVFAVPLIVTYAVNLLLG